MKRVAIVVQRYGLEVNGGAEYHARILAEKLKEKYEIEIITTTALEYQDWANHYPEGQTFINGIKVLRFPTIKRHHKKYKIYRRIILKKTKFQKALKFFGLFNLIDKNTKLFEPTHKECVKWLEHQGPFCPEMMTFIEEKKDNYHAFIFFTYLYHPTIIGMPKVGKKSIFIPTAHNEPFIYAKPYENIFSVPKFIMYNTYSERNLIEKNFKNFCKNTDIAGVGIDEFLGKEVQLPKELKQKKYFIYVGRINSAKGCEFMIDNFLKFKNNHIEQYSDIKLVLVGKNFMNKTYKSKEIIYTGFVSEEMKYTLIKNALAMIMPSFYESLSMVTLEAMMQKIPVIVNEKCEVLHHHIIASNSGDSYKNENDFENILKKYTAKVPEELKLDGERAQKYVLKNYRWEVILQKFDKAINFVTN